MSNFTPGPWWVDPEDEKWTAGIESSGFSVVIAGNKHKNEHDMGIQGGTPEQTAANAHLIAAAPEMYELLELGSVILTDIVTGSLSVDNEIERLKIRMDELLAEARGESE